MTDPLLPRNALVDDGSWIQDIIWDAQKVNPGIIEMGEEDFDDSDNAADSRLAKAADISEAAAAMQAKLDPFNLSNDHLYEHTREARFRIRQTFGMIEVVHSGPAKKLQMPWVCLLYRLKRDY